MTNVTKRCAGSCFNQNYYFLFNGKRMILYFSITHTDLSNGNTHIEEIKAKVFTNVAGFFLLCIFFFV